MKQEDTSDLQAGEGTFWAGEELVPECYSNWEFGDSSLK